MGEAAARASARARGVGGGGVGGYGWAARAATPGGPRALGRPQGGRLGRAGVLGFFLPPFFLSSFFYLFFLFSF
jgi:hypothetical protein